MFLAPNARVIIAAAPPSRAAAAGGLVTTTRMLGIGLSATLVGALLSVGAGFGSAPSLIAVALVGVALLCILVRPRSGA